jgi:SAM-dependent methyltransferase
MPEFSSRDPNSPAFWDERFEQGFTPWDRGGVPEALRAFVAQRKPMRTLIPGCGTGYELAFLSEAGWDATAIDFSPAAVQAAKAAVGRWSGKVEQADFFAWQAAQPLELIYERAFLCAMPRSMWPQVVARWTELLPPGALLAGFFSLTMPPRGRRSALPLPTCTPCWHPLSNASTTRRSAIRFLCLPARSAGKSGAGAHLI